MGFNLIDIGIIIFILLYALRGYTLGFIKTVFGIVKIVGAIILTKLLFVPLWMKFKEIKEIYTPFEKYITDFLSMFGKVPNLSTEGPKIIFMILLFTLIAVVLFIFVEIINTFFAKGPLKEVNNFLGFVLGGLKGVFYLMVATALLDPFLSLMLNTKLMDYLSKSFLFKYMYSYNIVLMIFRDLVEAVDIFW